MGDKLPELGLRYNAEHAQLHQGVFLARALERGLKELRSDQWASAANVEPEPEHLLVRHAYEGHESLVFEHDGKLVSATQAAGGINVTVAGASQDDVAATLAWLHEVLPRPDPVSRHEVTVTFWTYSGHGPQPAWRSIAVPGWEDIEANYSAQTRAGLERLMRGFEPARGGQLVLWHGKPGTGKTFALRALAWEWRRWCEFHYIVDPDTFFGQRADYLMGVLLQPGYGEVRMHPRFGAIQQTMLLHGPGPHVEVIGEEEEDESQPKPWRVLLLEDTGELLSADARELMGQGLSRFLNVVDGLIGQGLRVLALVTTNEEIRRLHPAVARPGRAAANVEFEPLSAEEAQAWLAARSVDGLPPGSQTLAELYARAEGVDPSEQSLVGFGDE
jgi:Domain of unknown function (DUF5925)/ATPase family associated with various cellular activities (AAA)